MDDDTFTWSKQQFWWKGIKQNYIITLIIDFISYQ